MARVRHYNDVVDNYNAIASYEEDDNTDVAEDDNIDAEEEDEDSLIEQEFYGLRESGDFRAIVTKIDLTYSKGSETCMRRMAFLEIDTPELMQHLIKSATPELLCCLVFFMFTNRVADKTCQRQLYQALLKRDNLLSQLDSEDVTEVLYKVVEASRQFRKSSTSDLYYEIDFYNNVVRDLVAVGLDPNIRLYSVSLFTHLLDADNHIAAGYLAVHPKFVASPEDQATLQRKLEPLLHLQTYFTKTT